MLKNKPRFVFLPDSYIDEINGSHLFQGQPCPTNKVFNIIGSKGVKEIDKEIKRLIKNRIELIGKRADKSHGFWGIQEFIDTKKKVSLLLETISDDYVKGDFHNPKLAKRNNYIISLSQKNKHIDNFQPDEIIESHFKDLSKTSLIILNTNTHE